MKNFKGLKIDFTGSDKKSSWLKKKWNTIYDFYWIHLGWKLREFWRGVKNLWRWFPVIWKDRDWDDHYIWEILKIKLKHQSDYIGSRDIHIGAKYDAQKMMLCVRLIEKIQNEFYSSEYFDYHESEYNWIPVDGETEYMKLDIETISENYDEYFAKHKASVRKVLSDERYHIFKLDDSEDYKQRLAMNVAHYNEKRAQELLFKILNRDIRGWWD